MPASPAFISHAPRSVAAWAACFDDRQLPVLASTAVLLEGWRVVEDQVDAHLLAESLSTDPLVTLKLLAHVARLRRGREGSEPETVTEALVMLGITPFFNAFGPQPTVEEQLAEQPDALAGFEAVLRRCHRAAAFAYGFALHRGDHDAAVIHQAALLHDFAELLLWLRAPALALQMAARQAAEPTLRSSAVQLELFNVELADVQHALMLAWHLPALLVQITDEHPVSPTAQVRNVQLAIRVARHTAHGWDNPALPDDVHDIAQLLHMSPEHTLQLLQQIDAD
jgi:HD-like signal output (HDOD) protein